MSDRVADFLRNFADPHRGTAKDTANSLGADAFAFVDLDNDAIDIRSALIDHYRDVWVLTRHVRGLVEFQRLTGCRPGEACSVSARYLLPHPWYWV
jgi:hypothetical protein